jgi:hypothetical protein
MLAQLLFRPVTNFEEKSFAENNYNTLKRKMENGKREIAI